MSASVRYKQNFTLILIMEKFVIISWLINEQTGLNIQWAQVKGVILNFDCTVKSAMERSHVLTLTLANNFAAFKKRKWGGTSFIFKQASRLRPKH